MAAFTPRTYPEILGDMYDRLIASTPLTDVNFGSVWTTMLEAAAQEDDEQYFQMLEIIRGYSLDTTTGSDLDNRAFEYGLTRIQASKASTVVTIGDDAIIKVSTGVYSGLPGAVAGSQTINADSATGFPTSGSIVIGRGTPNVETVPYSSITTFSNFVRFNLSAGLAFDHGTDEEIVLSQGGDRLIPIGTIVLVPDSDINPQIDFELQANATILDGEEVVENVPVVALEAGSNANVPIGAIQEFTSLPFSTATVSNPNRITNGSDIETDQELRDRIKNTIQSLSRGTPTSITTGVIGVVSASENKRVVSASLIEPTVPADVVRLYIDDGTGFIPTFRNIGFESVVSSATGGEQFLQIDNVPVVKAFVETQLEEPFSLSSGDLFVEVNGVSETIIFTTTDFNAPGAATAQEVLEVINANAVLFEARLSSGGTKVRIFARDNVDEEIRVTGGSANAGLDFPTDQKFTTKIYLKRDNVVSLLSKDGRTATIEAGNNVNYDLSSMSNLSLVLDGKTKNVLNAWFSPGNFTTPGSVTAQEVSDEINEQVPGLVAAPSSNDTRFSLASNISRSSNSKIKILENFDLVWNEESSTLVDRTSEVQTNSSNVTIFGSDLDYVYVGRQDGPFETVYFGLASVASASIVPVFEFWNGAAWEELGVYDGTEGMTQSGHIIFGSLPTWVPTVVNGSDAMYFLRIQRNNASAITAPVESRIRICNANEVFGFSETEVVGSDKDYTLNRFLGQVELVDSLEPGDSVTIGSFETRAALVTVSSGSFGLSGGELLEIVVDGNLQSYTFQASDFALPGSALESEVVAAINNNFVGLTASIVGTQVKIESNRYVGGSLRVNATAANTVLQFPTDLRESLVSHVPSIVSDAGPFSFSVDDELIVIMDDNAANNFTVPAYRAGEVTTGTSTTVFADTSLNPIFPLDDQLNTFDIEFTSGVNSGERRTISDYVAASAQITVSAPFTGTPSAGDTYQIIPVSVENLVQFWNNRQITLLSNEAEIKEVGDGSRLQIASREAGELASIEVAGGTANTELNFILSRVIGVDGYRHFTGLAQEVQWTVDGRLDDQENYPGIRAAGTQTEVAEPVRKPVSVQLVVTPNEGVTLTAIANDVRSAVSAYVNNLGVGADVIRSEIICSVKETTGVFDVDVEIPAQNIAVSDRELARINEQDIIVG